VKHTEPGPQSALLVHVTNVHTCWTHAEPSVVETQEQPGVPLAQFWLQLVPDPVHVSAQVGTQNDRGVKH
jgi:hypothetical protein